MHSLSKIAVLVVLVVVFFALITQRVLVANEELKLSHNLFSFLFDSSSKEGSGEKLAPRLREKHHPNQHHRPNEAHHKHTNQTTSPIVINSMVGLENSNSNSHSKMQELHKIKEHKRHPGSSGANTVQHSTQPISKTDESPHHKVKQESHPHHPHHAGEGHHHKTHQQGHQIHNHTIGHHAHRKKHHGTLSRLHEPVKHNYHPNISPRVGTDISPQHHEMLIRCQNQTKCIVPDLQLRVKLKVYFCKKPVRSGARFYYLVKEGLLNHPNVELVSYEDVSSADLIVFLPASSPWHLTECTNKSFADKLIVLDEFDGHSAYLPYRTIEEAMQVYGKELNWYLTYFKRSFVSRANGVFLNYPHLQRPHFYPLVYSLAEMYIAESFRSQVGFLLSLVRVTC
jgi:hypothetical protein